MLQSLKLRADKLSGLPATAAAAAATTAAAAEELPPTPVAVNVNGQVYNLNKKPSNGNGNLIAENNSLNNIHQQQQQRYHYQQQQQQPQILLHQGKYSESFAATSPTAAAAAASKSFHPYLRPPPPLLPSAKLTTTTKSPPPSPSPSSATAATSETLFQAVLHKQINSGATTATAESALVAKTGALTDAAGAVGGPSPAPATTKAAAATADSSLTDSANQGLHFCRAMIKVEEDTSAAGDDPMGIPPSAELSLVPATGMVQQLDEFAKEEPDPDNIKMFVGQVPKAWDEKQLRALFEQFGRIHTLNVLRDKVTSVSRGCCFVTYYTRKAALRAQDALHNIKTLDGMHHPIQMKPADSENRNERKLFVGMLNKKYTESDVRQLFAGHGTIEECTVLRDQNGQSKGCAFVTFGTKQHAIGAIKALHQSQTMESCSAPLVVKFADTQKEKDQKKMQHLQPAMCGLSALSTPAAAASASAALTAPPTNGCLAAAAAAASGALVPTPIPGRQTASMAAALAAAVGPQQPQQVSVCASSLVPAPASALTVTPSLLSAAPTNQAASPYFCSDAALQASAAQLQLFQQLQAFGLHPTQYLQGPGADGLNSPFGSSLSALANGAAGHFAAAPLTAAALQAAAAGVAGKQIEGPEGSNLFIYHLPQEFTDTDLASTFLPFGNVLSAKVFIDKQTNLSKCFGFVSYDNPLSASAAIQAMHGFQIGTKRLKVQLKRSKDAAKPY